MTLACFVINGLQKLFSVLFLSTQAAVKYREQNKKGIRKPVVFNSYLDVISSGTKPHCEWRRGDKGPRKEGG